MNPKFLIAIPVFFTLYSFGQSNNYFSKKEVNADLDYLYESLQDAHYNIYAYATKEEFATAYQKAKNAINKDSLSLLEVTNIFQRFVSTAKNGHTEIDFPAQSYREYAFAGGTVFPIEIAFEDNKSLVRKNWSANNEIRVGSEIISINGLSMADILSKIYPQISAERPYFKNVKIELYSFPRLYWQVFGEHDYFTVEIRTNGAVDKQTVKAVNLVEDYEMKRTELFTSSMELKFIDDFACLNPGGFGGDEKKYQSFIDSAFTEINNKKTEILIIDFRNNPGGDNAFSDYLVSYFADQPFQWNSGFTLKTSETLKNYVRQNEDTTVVYWQEILKHKNGEIYDYEFAPCEPQPSEKRFTGKVYVLINRQSHSQSAVAAAQIQDYKFGILVGEETGEYPSLYASIFQYSLPNTKIPVKVSKGYITRVNGSTEEKGVMPDIFIKDHLLDENDEILKGLLKQLRAD